MAEMAEPWCDLCELPMANCPHGNTSAAAAEREVLEATGQRHSLRLPSVDLMQAGPTINATQHSPCPGCGETIELDESITYTAEGWAHTHEVTMESEVKPPTPTSIFDGIE